MTEDYSEAKFWVHCLIATVGAVLINLYSVELAILFGWCYGLLVSIKRGSAINITKSWTIGTTTLLFGWLYFSTFISDEMAIYTLCFLAAWICLLGFPYAFMKSLRHKNAEKRRKRVKELLVEKRKQRRDEKNNSTTDEELSVAETTTVVTMGVAQFCASWVWDNIKLYIIPFLGIDWFEHKKVIMGIIHIIICLVVAPCVGMAIDGALYAIIAPWVSGIALSLICNMYHND